MVSSICLIALADSLACEVLDVSCNGGYLSVRLRWDCCGCKRGTTLFWVIERGVYPGSGEACVVDLMVSFGVDRVGGLVRVSVRRCFEFVRYDDLVGVLMECGYLVYGVGGV